MDNSEKNAVYAIIVAAGKGKRMGSEIPKQLMPYGGSTVLEMAVTAFEMCKSVDSIIVVSPADGSLDEAFRNVLSRTGSGAEIVRGGRERADSVTEGLKAAASSAMRKGIEPERVTVLIHDAARPGITKEVIERNIDAMKTCEAAVTAVPSVDSVRMISSLALKESIDYPIMNTTVVDRRRVYCVQTPQTFRLTDIMKAYKMAERDGYSGTDDASIAEYAGISPAIVLGSPANSKITYREDIPMTTRVGTGYDVHRLVPGRKLILCGTPVPYDMGLTGHSDADAATHALMDALLGAAGLGDIGKHFPDNDPGYKDADSLKLLAEVREMLGDVTINNVDITIIAQAPRLAPFNKEMTENISKTLGIPESAVNIKATTEEGLGFTGRGEGIAAIATCAIEGRFTQ